MSKASQETTKHNKQRFLDNYPKFLRATKTAAAIGIGECTHYKWIEADEVYRKAFRELKKRVDSDRLEQIEKEVHDRAMGGTSKQSDILLMFEAKALDPGKYREKQAIPTIVGDITIKMAIPPYDEAPTNVIEGKYKEVTNGQDSKG